MKVSRLESHIALYGCLIMANTSEGVFAWIWISLAVINLFFWMYKSFNDIKL